MIIRMLLCLSAFSCSGLKLVSSRNDWVQSQGSTIFKHSGPKSRSTKPQEIFVKEKKVVIVDTQEAEDLGSLYRFGDQRNNLFTPKKQDQVGESIYVKIVSNRDLKNASDDSEKSENDGDEKSDENPILSSIPALEPDSHKNKNILLGMKMKVLERLPSGDVRAVFHRSSQNNFDINDIQVFAKIPFESLSSGDEITSQDLYDIEIVDSINGEVQNRNSSSWDDEYTLRMSGFTESKSKYAAHLDAKRLDINKFSESLKKQQRTMGRQRRQAAKERDNLIVDHNRTKKIVKKLEGDVEKQKTKISDQKTVIDEQKQEILDLQPPEDKEGDDEQSAEGV